MSTHLASCPNCEGEMDVTEVGPFTRVRCPGCGDEVRVKTEIGEYRLVRRLASGGMSVVYVARDTTLDREIAVKVLSEEYSTDPRREDAIEREARMTAAVSHPNVVRVFTVGRVFDRLFIAMELVSGQSLEERVSVHGALPEDEVIGLALQVADGLRAAQEAGLIHRDIKPGNILIDETGIAKIVDFGLSVNSEGGAVKVEEVWATPYYVAPEALDRSGEDHRSDIYALGATLYHALSGASPIETKERSKRALREVKRTILPLKEVAPWLSSETVRTVEKAMHYDPAKRFESYDELRVSLETARGILEAKGPRYPVHGTVRARRRERQAVHRKAWLAAGVFLVLVLATATAYLVAKMRPPESPDAKLDGSLPVIDPGRDPSLDPEIAMAINEMYEGAREALSEDDFVVAEEQFLRVWKHERSPVATASWAGFEATVAAYLDGRGGDARRHLAKLSEFLIEKRQEDSKLGRRLLSSIEVLTALSFVPEERVPKILGDPFRATAYFVMALKSWEQGQLERAHSMFERLGRAGPWPDAGWMDIYQMQARRYADDFRQLSRADRGIEGKSAAEIEEAIGQLDEIYASLQTRGRARFNVKMWQTDMMRTLRELKARRVTPQWKELREEVERELMKGRFVEGGLKLAGAKAEGEGRLESDQRAALIELAARAGEFLEAVQDGLVGGLDGAELRTRQGGSYSRIIGSQDGGLLVEEDGAARFLRWEEIAPISLVLFHRVLVEASEDPAEKGHLLLQAVGFAWLSGLKPEADGLAGELIEIKPSFESEWAKITQSLGDQ